MFTKIGSFLGAVSFGLIVATFTHQVMEVHNYVPPPTIEQQMKNVVAITTDEAYCSGWVLKGTHQVVTAAHCAPADDTAVLNVDFGDGVKHPFHIQHKGDRNGVTGPDLMTLTTSDTTVHWPAGESVCTFKPYRGEALTMFGGPLAFSWTTTFGYVSQPDSDLMSRVQGLGSPMGKFDQHMIQWDGEMWPGNSGGMVIDSDTGCVMGSAEAIYMAGENVGVKFLQPASDLAIINK